MLRACCFVAIVVAVFCVGVNFVCFCLFIVAYWWFVGSRLVWI